VCRYTNAQFEVAVSYNCTRARCSGVVTRGGIQGDVQTVPLSTLGLSPGPGSWARKKGFVSKPGTDRNKTGARVAARAGATGLEAVGHAERVPRRVGGPLPSRPETPLVLTTSP